MKGLPIKELKDESPFLGISSQKRSPDAINCQKLLFYCDLSRDRP